MILNKIKLNEILKTIYSATQLNHGRPTVCEGIQINLNERIIEKKSVLKKFDGI